MEQQFGSSLSCILKFGILIWLTLTLIMIKLGVCQPQLRMSFIQVFNIQRLSKFNLQTY